MFYVIATVLIIVGLFFVYSAISAFNELRKGIKKKVQAKPYMVILFLIVAIIFFLLSAVSIIYQSTWDQNWNTFWIDVPPLFSDETRIKIFEVVHKIEPLTLYATFGLGGLFSISLVTFRKLSAHLLIATMSFAVITFISFIIIQYTEPQKNSLTYEQNISVENKNSSNKFQQVDAISRDSITRYLNNQSTDVLNLTQFLKQHFKISRNISDSNVDQLRQYSRGLTEIKQKLSHVEVPRGAENSADLINLWLQQEIKIVGDCLAEKRQTGILGLVVKLNNFASDVIFNRTKEHHEITDEVRRMRAEFVTNEDLKIEGYFSFIKNER